MNKQEFEERTGIKLTEEEYQKVEEMYMLCGDVNKDDFCDDYKKHKDSIILNVFFKQADRMELQLKHRSKERSGLVDFLLDRAQKFGDSALLLKAICMVGHTEVIKRKIKAGLPFWDEDMDYIMNNIK